MRRHWPIPRCLRSAAAVLLAAALVCCAPQQSVTQPPDPPESAVSQTESAAQSSDAVPDFAVLMLTSAAERVADADFLTAVWEDYLHFTYMNLSNGYVGFDAVEDIPVQELASYLYIQMQRAGDDAGSSLSQKYRQNPDGSYAFGISRPKLEEYCERYFGRSIDFASAKNPRDPTAFVYRADTDTCHFYPGTTLEHFEQNHVDYNQGDDWPYFSLNFIDRFAGGVYMADCSYDAVNALAQEKLTKKFVMKQREDGSFYFVSCHLVWPQTHYIQAEGSFTELPLYDSVPYEVPMLAEGASPGTALVLLVYTPLEARYALLDLTNGETLRSVTVPAGGIAGVFGTHFVSAAADGLRVWNLDLIEEAPVRAWTRNFCEAAGLTGGQKLSERIGGVDFSEDLQRMSFSDDEGVRLYDFAKDSVTTVPGTAPYRDPQNEVASEGYTTTWLVDGGKKLFACRVGWEWTVGYLLYDTGTGKTFEYPYGGGYGIGRTLTDSAAYLTGHDGAQGSIMIDFATGKVLASDIAPEPGVWREGGGRFDAFFEPVEGRNTPGDGLLTQRLAVRDGETGQIARTDFILTAPAGSERIFGVTRTGKVYVYAEYLGERYFWQIG